MYGIGMQELLLILVIVVLIFGSKKLPRSAAGLAKPSAIQAGQLGARRNRHHSQRRKEKRRHNPFRIARSDFSSGSVLAGVFGKICQNNSTPPMEAGSNARHIRKATMKVEQLSIFLENKAGRLAQVTKTLAEAGINIRALSLADTSDFGILRLIVNDTEKAINIMKEAGFTVGRTAVVAVEVDDKPGGLNNILEALSGQNVNVEYMYAFVQEGGGSATMIFRFDRIDQAIEVLKAKNIPIIPADRING